MLQFAKLEGLDERWVGRLTGNDCPAELDSCSHKWEHQDSTFARISVSVFGTKAASSSNGGSRRLLPEGQKIITSVDYVSTRR
mgnify:CR=1 FL=1